MNGDAFVVGFDGSRDGDFTVVIGQIGSDGLTYVSELPGAAGRADQAPTTRGDILDQIDAAVTRAAETELCACGCRRAIPSDGASPFFASQGCQRRWHGERTDEPEDVYSRPDAVPYVGLDSWPAPMSDAPTARTAEAFPEPEPLLLPPCDDPHGTAYRRRCPACGERVIPHVFIDGHSEVSGWGRPDPIRLVFPPPRHICSACNEDLPGPVFLANVRDQGDLIVLELRDDQSRVRRALPIRNLTRTPNPGPLIERTWTEMENLLRNFRTTWQGRTGHQAQGGA